jgi:hypothetical protein
MAFAWAAKITLPAWVPILIGLTAWSVYIADRLLDARAGLRSAQIHSLRRRHLFHWRHRHIFVPLALAAACAAAAIVAFFMPPAALARNTVLGACALAYFSRVHVTAGSQSSPAAAYTARVFARINSKELLVGLIFTATCVLPALSRISNPRPLLLPAVLFALLAWLNCHAIESWESRTGRRNIFPLATALSLTGLLCVAFLAAGQPRPAALLAMATASAMLLALLDRVRPRLNSLALRAAADLALLTPVLLTPALLLVHPLAP